MQSAHSHCSEASIFAALNQHPSKLATRPRRCVQDVAASDGGQRFPLAILPVGKSNDVSRVSGWGNVSKGDWHSRATVPDLLSAVTAAPEVRVDFWRTRIASADKSMLKGLPKSFMELTKEVRHSQLLLLDMHRGLRPYGHKS